MIPSRDPSSSPSSDDQLSAAEAARWSANDAFSRSLSSERSALWNWNM